MLFNNHVWRTLLMYAYERVTRHTHDDTSECVCVLRWVRVCALAPAGTEDARMDCVLSNMDLLHYASECLERSCCVCCTSRVVLCQRVERVTRQVHTLTDMCEEVSVDMCARWLVELLLLSKKRALHSVHTYVRW